MGTVEVLTKDRMLAIEAASVVDGTVDEFGHLVLEKFDGTLIDAGEVTPTAIVQAEDSSSVDVTVTGNGSLATPYKVKAEAFPTTVTGLLAADYRGPGPASVLIDGDVTYTPNLDWLVKYIPWGSRRVTLTRYLDRWVITGQTQHELVVGGHRSVCLTPGPNWYSYNEISTEDSWAEPRAVQLPSGLVVLSGLLKFNNGVPAAATVIASGLPASMCPEFDVIHYANNSDQTKSLTVRPNGTITVRGSYVSNGYVALDNIAYWPAGTATWTPIGSGGSSFGANFEATSGLSLTYGTPAFYKDVYGFVWFRGLISVKVATTVDNTVLINLPSTHLADMEQHFRAVGNDGYSGIGARNTGLNWKTNTVGAVGQWLSLSSVVITTTDAITSNPWYNIPAYLAGWSRYMTTYPIPAVVRRGDGLALSKGMLDSGTQGVGRVFTMPQELWPEGGRMILDGMAGHARYRLDISGVLELDPPRRRGGVSIINGTSTSWYSLDGFKWAVAL